MKQYDYIISGAGAAGLSLLMHMLQHSAFHQKKILVVDKTPKENNDRTWCFWEQQPGLFEPVVHHEWHLMHFYSQTFSGLLDLSPYRYKMIRSINFYNHVRSAVQQHKNVTFIYGQVEGFANEGNGAAVVVNGERINAGYVFNSILLAPPAVPADKYYLLQHFKGWYIETEAPVFNAQQATLMDFRVSQQHGTTFVYVLPLSAHRALVEYTLFTPQTLAPEAYDKAIAQYIHTYCTTEPYTITEQEFGIIPMTNITFPHGMGRLVNIGTAGGQTKASTGYTFRFIQKQSASIVQALLHNNNPHVQASLVHRRFGLYDSTLLNVLHHRKMGGDDIFARMFSKNPPDRVLRFLDNESNLEDEINIMASVPSGLFMKAAFQELFR